MGVRTAGAQTGEIRMEDWERAAREEIRELAARYNQAGDSGRFEEMLTLFAEDARLDIEFAELPLVRPKPPGSKPKARPGKSYRITSGHQEIRLPRVQTRPGESYRGRREIRALLEKSARAEGAPQRLRHFTASHQIDFESPLCARGRAYFLVLTAQGLDHWGLYRDEYRRAAPNAPWRFTRRQVRVEGRTPGGWAARRG